MNRATRSALAGLAIAVGATLALTACSSTGGLVGGVASASSPSATPNASTATPHVTPSSKPKATKVKDKEEADAESAITIADPGKSWSYPATYAKFVKSYGYSTEKVNGQEIPVFVIGSNSPGRLYCDSVRPVLDDTSKSAILAHILAEPDYAAQIGSGLAQVSIAGTGKTLVELVPVVAMFKDPSFINEWAESVVNGNAATRLAGAKTMALIALAVDQFSDAGIVTATTSLNMHLVGAEDGGCLSRTSPYSIQPFEINPVQYTGTFRKLVLAYKGQTGCRLEIGINVLDGRFAYFACPTPKPPTPACTDKGCVTGHGCDAKTQWWNGVYCLDIKIGSNTPNGPQGTGVMPNDDLTDGKPNSNGVSGNVTDGKPNSSTGNTTGTTQGATAGGTPSSGSTTIPQGGLPSAPVGTISAPQ